MLHRKKCPLKAQPLNSVSLLRERKICCCRATGKPSIRAGHSKDQKPNSQTAREINFALAAPMPASISIKAGHECGE